MGILVDIIAVLAGFGLLIWSADHFVTGASATARNLGVSPLIIGLTIVGFGTSAPEMLVSTFAAIDGNAGLSIGNALGSNITNITLILGATALFYPLSVHSGILRREYPLLLITTVIAALLLFFDNHLSRIDGIIMFSSLFLILFWMVRYTLKHRDHDPLEAEYEHEIPEHMPMKTAMAYLGAGLVVLLASSKLLVWGATNIAVALGVSDLIIGLTVVAIGTSLPELAASVMSAKKGEHDIAIGNVIGSNMFNTLGVLAIPGLIAPGLLPEGVLERDLPLVIILTVLLFVLSFGFTGPGRINRLEGGFFLGLFVVYEIVLYFSATS
ncbi:MAG TPA: calcium/sodium antiporter [Gammaproteobacteria bacterium]